MPRHFASMQSRFTLVLLWALVSSLAWGAEQIVLDGSSGMLPLAKALASAYQQRSSAPQVEIGKGLGTGARLRALGEGKIQIALASHGIKPEDVQKGNLKIIEVAKGAIVFAVNASVPITNITESQIVMFTAARSKAGDPWAALTIPWPCLPGLLRKWTPRSFGPRWAASRN